VELRISVSVSGRFGQKYRFLFQEYQQHIKNNYWILGYEADPLFETSRTTYLPTQFHVPEERILHFT
jgi:hypothetical protein